MKISAFSRIALPFTTLSIVSVMAISAFAAPPAGRGPAGNNGTVKIDGVDFDDHQNNEPHPGCLFEIEFYGYDEGDLEATYRINMKAPTKGPEVASGSVPIGGDPAGGGTDLDGVVLLDIGQALFDSGVAPHPIQGYHVKLTVNAEGSQGADVKHKTYWVDCEEPEPSPTPTETPTVQPTIETSEPPEDDTEVLGEIFTKPKGKLATTASPTEQAVLVGMWFIGAGWLLRSIRRVRREY